jgi:hypothetical protein
MVTTKDKEEWAHGMRHLSATAHLALLPGTRSLSSSHFPQPTMSSTIPYHQPMHIYWDSSEAKLLFQPNPSENNALE